MAGPYRESDASSIDCPRCGLGLPSGTLMACSANCGMWVGRELAHSVLDANELALSRLTTWFRERAACPYCAEMMTLRGYDMSLFQGCDAHGFWLDNETIGQTSLGRATNADLLKRARRDAEALKLERERAERARREDDRANMSAADLARREAEDRAEAARVLEQRRYAEFLPYLEMARGTNPTILARKLQELDRIIYELRKRIEDLEARESSTPPD